MLCCFAQTGDSPVPLKDTGRPRVAMPAHTGGSQHAAADKTDTVTYSVAPVKPDTVKSPAHKVSESYFGLLRQHPYFNFFGTPRVEIVTTHRHSEQDGLFYLFIGMVLYYALVRLVFGKYLSNLFTVFFRVSLKQKQIREQLMQSPLPSLLLNIFFVITGGIFLALLLRYYHYLPFVNIWHLMAYTILAIAVIYILKFIILKLMGWIFYVSEATDTYIFAIFLVNKILGILLIPFVVLLAFSGPVLAPVLIILTLMLIAMLFIYRYVISFAPVKKEIKVSQFHFFLYLCGFEIIPLLLIYKVLITYLERSI